MGESPLPDSHRNSPSRADRERWHPNRFRVLSSPRLLKQDKAASTRATRRTKTSFFFSFFSSDCVVDRRFFFGGFCPRFSSSFLFLTPSRPSSSSVSSARRSFRRTWSTAGAAVAPGSAINVGSASTRRSRTRRTKLRPASPRRKLLRRIEAAPLISRATSLRLVNELRVAKVSR